MRRARAEDKEPLMQFIRNVWGGHDYIPEVWDEWIADRSAEMFVVEADGTPVALNRVRRVEDGSAWFEGARVHPDFRGRGLATMLGGNSMEVARKWGAKTFRLTSNSRNHSAHRQVARMKFAEIGRISIYEAGKARRFKPVEGVRAAVRDDVGKVRRLIQESDEYRLGNGMMWDGFTAVSLTPEVIERRVAEGAVLLGAGGVAIAVPGREGKLFWNEVGFLGGDPKEAVRLAHHAFATRGRSTWRFAVVPQGSPIIGALRKDGMKRSFALILFERKAAKG